MKTIGLLRFKIGLNPIFHHCSFCKSNKFCWLSILLIILTIKRKSWYNNKINYIETYTYALRNKSLLPLQSTQHTKLRTSLWKVMELCEFHNYVVWHYVRWSKAENAAQSETGWTSWSLQQNTVVLKCIITHIEILPCSQKIIN